MNGWMLHTKCIEYKFKFHKLMQRQLFLSSYYRKLSKHNSQTLDTSTTNHYTLHIPTLYTQKRHI